MWASDVDPGPAPAMSGPRPLPAKAGRDFRALPGGVLAGPGKHGACVRKVRKFGKMSSVMPRIPFLTFPTFLTLGTQKKAAG
jgi:hypothetical protein